MTSFSTEIASNAQIYNGILYPSTQDILNKTSGRVELFYKSVRGLNSPLLYRYLSEAANENILDAFLLAFYIRDCRGGKGERDLGRRAFIWLFLNYTEHFEKIILLISEYGRWDDLLQFFPRVLNLTDIDYIYKNYNSRINGTSHLSKLCEIQRNIVGIVSKQLLLDKDNMKAGNPISLCAKWAPTEKDSLDRSYGVVNTLCSSYGFSTSLRKYRKEYITPLRQYLKIVEIYMCRKEWEKIKYSKVPSCAMKILKKCFEKHSPQTFREWKESLQKKEVVNKTEQLQPHELIRDMRIKGRSDELCEARWQVIEKNINDMGTFKDSVVIVDTSSSMYSNNYIPFDVELAMGLIISRSNKGPFNNQVITFNNNPQFIQINDGTLYNRWNEMKRIPVGSSLNLKATFDMILDFSNYHNLSKEDIPKKLFIFSDTQFEQNVNKTNFQLIEKKYKKSGYIRPQIIFWNVNNFILNFPVYVCKHNTTIISGFSPSIMKLVIEGSDFSSYSLIRETLDKERYNLVRNAFVTNL
jgi:hypothetical protein